MYKRQRQTFYYHFQDKYELLDWIYYQEGFVYLASDVTFDNWHQHMEKLLTMMRENQIFYENTISASPQCFEDYLFQITCTLFEEAIRRLDGSLRLQEADVRLYSRFYSYGMCGIICDWVRGGMKESPKSLSLRIRKSVSYTHLDVYKRQYLHRAVCQRRGMRVSRR